MSWAEFGPNTRTASCTCGALRLRVAGDPAGTYSCNCLACKRTTGSAFAYRARFLKSDVLAIEGEHKRWRRTGDSGRWVDHVFCPSCGALLFMEAEGLPDAIAVSVGCFADPGFAPPASWYWSSHTHGWIEPPSGARRDDR